MIFTSHASAEFWELYSGLPEAIQQQADKQYALFETHPDHPSLLLKPVGSFWSVRVSRSYRALAVRRGNGFYWFWIGPHDEYEQLIEG